MAKRRREVEGTIRQKSPNCWEARVPGTIDFATGNPVRISRYTSTKKEAVQLLHHLQYEMRNNNYRASHISLGDWLDLWLKTYTPVIEQQGESISNIISSYLGILRSSFYCFPV